MALGIAAIAPYLLRNFEQQDFDLGPRNIQPKVGNELTRVAKGNTINRAAQEASDVAGRDISRGLGESLRQRDLNLAGTGLFSSGERIRRGDVLRSSASRDMADALARIGLQRQGLTQQYNLASTNQQFQIAQAEELAKQQEIALWASMISNLFGTGSDFVSSQRQGEENFDQNQQLMQMLTLLGGG